jgi:hypothetical protein
MNKVRALFAVILYKQRIRSVTVLRYLSILRAKSIYSLEGFKLNLDNLIVLKAILGLVPKVI